MQERRFSVLGAVLVLLEPGLWTQVGWGLAKGQYWWVGGSVVALVVIACVRGTFREQLEKKVTPF